jgi:hypothetical protein
VVGLGAVSWSPVAWRVERLGGQDQLNAVCGLLQRARSAYATGGVWEAADVQWWWRRRRQTDDRPLPVWFDEFGPCGAVVLADFGGRWQGDALVVPRTVELDVVWSELLHETERANAPALDVLANEEDKALLALLEASGFTATEKRSGITWMDAADCPAAVPVTDGYRVTDRSSHAKAPHPMATRNGDEIEARLRQCSLYGPELDLAVYTPSGDPAAYGLFWFDELMGVGMLEPLRVEETHRRKGLARALITGGLNIMRLMPLRRWSSSFW